MNATSLDERIKRLEDIEDIKNLTARYAFHVSKGWDGKVVDVEEMPSIFAKDARWEHLDMNMSGVSLDVIMKSLPETTADVEFSMHSFINPIIAIDGDKATGNWLMLIGSKIEGSSRGVFIHADFMYVRTTQGWRIQTANLQSGMILKSIAETLK